MERRGQGKEERERRRETEKLKEMRGGRKEERRRGSRGRWN